MSSAWLGSYFALLGLRRCSCLFWWLYRLQFFCLACCFFLRRFLSFLGKPLYFSCRLLRHFNSLLGSGIIVGSFFRANGIGVGCFGASGAHGTRRISAGTCSILIAPDALRSSWVANITLLRKRTVWLSNPCWIRRLAYWNFFPNKPMFWPVA